MDKFKVGDKVYSKEGNIGKELGTITGFNKKKKLVKVRLFKDQTEIDNYSPDELLTKEEYEQKLQEEMSKMPKKRDHRIGQ